MKNSGRPRKHYTQPMLGQAQNASVARFVLNVVLNGYVYVRKYYNWKGQAVESKLSNEIMNEKFTNH